MGDVMIRVDTLPEWLTAKHFKGMIYASIEDLIATIEDLDSDVERLEEELEDLKKDVEDNYRPLTTAEQIGWSENW